MSETTKNTITIDGKEYSIDSLSENAKTQLSNIRVVDEDIRKIEQKLSIYRTARATYARALKDELDKAQLQAH